MNQEKIGSFIAQRRKDKKLTQAKLASYLGISDRTISKWERGESLPDILVFKQLADLFGVNVDYLITEHTHEIKPNTKKRFLNLNNHKIIMLLSLVGVWFLATVIASMAGIAAATALVTPPR